MAKLTVSEIKHVLTSDIDLTQTCDVKVLDEYVNTCITAAQNALQSSVPLGFSDYPGDIELVVKVTEAWKGLSEFTLLSRSVWERRAKNILLLISI